MLLGFKEYEVQARQLAKALGCDYATVQSHEFPDGETKITLPSRLPAHVILCRSLDHPNNKLIELLLAAATARELGASRLTLVAPYLCYMRQDIAFNPGEAVSQTIIGGFLGGLFDDVITVDPHLHRIHELREAVPANHALALSARREMQAFLSTRAHAILMGPDSESEQWVAGIAEAGGLQYGVASKQRLGDRDIRISLPALDLQDRPVVLVDDVVSSGETIAVAARHCLEQGAKRVDVLVTHALFAAGACERLQQAGVGEIWSSDSIVHQSNCIPLAGLFAEALRDIS